MCVWCQIVLNWIWEQIWKPVQKWVTDLITKCNRQPCNWWCLCCNKWFCWIFAIIIAIIVFIVSLILTVIAMVVCVACFIICFVLCIAFWISQKTPMENCINWCNTAKLAPWEREDPVDPQKPIDIDGPSTGGGVSG